MSTSLTGATKNWLHYNLERTDYSVTEDELTRFRQAGSSPAKDVCLVSMSLGIPCLINALHDTTSPFVLDLSLFLNYLLGVLGIILASIYGIQWYKTHLSIDELIDSVKKKPRLEVTLADTRSSGEPQIAVAPPAQTQQPPEQPPS